MIKWTAQVDLYQHMQLRKNEDVHRATIDLNDPFLVEGPAKGAHNGRMEVICRA